MAVVLTGGVLIFPRTLQFSIDLQSPVDIISSYSGVALSLTKKIGSKAMFTKSTAGLLTSILISLLTAVGCCSNPERVNVALRVKGPINQSASGNGNSALTVDVVIVFPEDAGRCKNSLLCTDKGITVKEWTEKRPGGDNDNKDGFCLPENQILCFGKDWDGRFGTASENKLIPNESGEKDWDITLKRNKFNQATLCGAYVYVFPLFSDETVRENTLIKPSKIEDGDELVWKIHRNEIVRVTSK